MNGKLVRLRILKDRLIKAKKDNNLILCCILVGQFVELAKQIGHKLDN